MSNPYFPPAPAQSQRPVASGRAMKRRNPFVVWLPLPFITFGIYSLVWYYKINKELGEFDWRKRYRPGLSLLAITLGALVIVPQFVSVFNTGKRIRDAEIAAGMPPTCSPWVGFLLIFVFGTYSLYYQVKLNAIIDRYQAPLGTEVPLYV